ncbi:flagellar FlbD family protein [Nocardioides humilatus]|uniref:Flagellar FlbD family protein n=1 Tax=Nocardioides humilatus TaxID=2607660 RepID=A0A5B1LBS0_9ACTN|nr:flagellar FlbD family protein [Nocardioides humilatus]KAA1417698.1 flagellar FlbD family protein [Nocardioides humilatus]
MITLTRLSGTVFLLNVDLIERMDATPDTVITLVDGKKYVVCESLDTIRREVVLYRAEILATVASYDTRHPVPEPRHGGHLSAVPSKPTDSGTADPALGGERS